MDNDSTKLLIVGFRKFLEAYDRYCPFSKYGQLEHHVETVRRRLELGSAAAALNDVAFQRSLYRTLQAWGIGSRRSALRPFPAFVAALKDKAAEIESFDGLLIDQPDLDVAGVSLKLARLIQALDIVDNKTRLVPGTKALHHLLPELVVPMDREYTQSFFGWHNPQFQNYPERRFGEAFRSFVTVARLANPAQYLKGGWYSSRTKVIDNAIVGLCCLVRREAS